MKYGESYESLARNIEPYLHNTRNMSMYSPSLYPMWWDTTITIYNRYEEPQTNFVTWYRNILDSCFFKNTNNNVTIGKTSFETNNIILRIPENKNYMSYGEWICLPESERKNCFTLHQGDIIVKGESDDEIDEYKTGMRSSDLLTKYKNIGICLVISTYQDNTGGGRCTPHYYISGE